jgi:hypothetical protein
MAALIAVVIKNKNDFELLTPVPGVSSNLNK